MFGQSTQHLLGIDISSSAVKVLELRLKGENYGVESYAVEPLPVNAVVEGKIEDESAVSTAIRRAVKRSGSKTKHAAVAVSSNSVITKVISYPGTLGERDMEEQVLFEAESLIPYPLNEVRLDFEVTGSSESDDNAIDILLVASRRENVDARTSVLEEAGLKPKLVDVEAYTIENVYSFLSPQLPLSGQGMTVAVIDVGATATTVYVLDEGKIVFTHDQAFGGKMLTENISQHYGMSIQDAGQAKKENNLPNDYEFEILDPFKQLMMMTVTRALQFFFSTSTEYQSIDHILLSGGCASIPGVIEMIEEDTETTTTIANPFKSMKRVGSKLMLSSLNSDAPAMLIACGLAMRSFD